MYQKPYGRKTTPKPISRVGKEGRLGIQRRDVLEKESDGPASEKELIVEDVLQRKAGEMQTIQPRLVGSRDDLIKVAMR